MTRLYQLKRMLRQYGVELEKTRITAVVGGIPMTFFFFVYDGKQASVPCTSENDTLSHAEVARIARVLGLPNF